MLTQEMNALAREITSAQDARLAATARLAGVRAALAKREAARSAGVRSSLAALRADRNGAHGAWQDLAASLHAKRVTSAEPTAPAAKPAPAPAPVVAAKPAAAPVPAATPAPAQAPVPTEHWPQNRRDA